MASVTLSLILEKIASRDKDFRYMATSDLANELAKDSFRFDSPASEKQVSDVVLTQLEDSSGDISGLAVKCLGYLVNKNRTEQLQEVVAALCSKLLTSNKEQLRDVASLGLKTVVAELSSKKAGTLVAAATPRLIEGLQAQASDVVSSSLDILAELTARYGGVLPDQEGLKRALLPELDESRAGVRKRAIQCLASLAASLPPHSLDDLCATGKNGQGNDHGSQYRTGIYWHNEEQQKVAQARVAAIPGCAVEAEAFKSFWPAEEYHQQYLEKGGRGGRGQCAAKGCTDPIRCYG